MQNIQIAECKKYEDYDRYQLIENDIYLDTKDLEDTRYRMTISYELINEKEGNNNQYPLEDILGKYLIHVSDFYEAENIKGENKFKYELAGELSNLKKSQEIIGKKVFNQIFINEAGQEEVRLIIEGL